MKLEAGMQAPEFTLADQDGKMVSLKDFKGSKLLIYFYPKADTPGCTKQACSLRDYWAELKKAGVTVLGISPDTVEEQHKFAEKYTLNFALLADPDHQVAEAYGVWDKKSLYGKLFFGIIRSSFLIDESGKIAETWYKVKPEETAPKALEAAISAH